MSTLFVSTNRNVPFQIYMFHMAAVRSNGRYQQNKRFGGGGTCPRGFFRSPQKWREAPSPAQVSKLKHLLTLYEQDYFFFPGPPWWPKAGRSGNTIMELVDLARGGGT